MARRSDYQSSKNYIQQIKFNLSLLEEELSWINKTFNNTDVKLLAGTNELNNLKTQLKNTRNEIETLKLIIRNKEQEIK